MVAPHVIILNTLYHATIILLHRPFISNSHLKSSTIRKESWKRCTNAARNITSLILAYEAIHPLRRAQYILRYCVYVACTIHVPNVSALQIESESHSFLLNVSLMCLDELAIPNSGSSYQGKIIRKLMEHHGVQNGSSILLILQVYILTSN